MKIVYFFILVASAFFLSGCNEDGYMSGTDLGKSGYNKQEKLPEKYLELYGKWHLYSVSGGFHGMGYIPQFNLLEVDSSGIYKIFKNENLLEWGRFKPDTFDTENTQWLQAKFIPDSSFNNHLMYRAEKYVVLHNDSAEFYSPCCDMFDYHFRRVR